MFNNKNNIYLIIGAILVVILLILYIITKNNNNNNNNQNMKSNKPNLWLYWEGPPMPSYIEMCKETIYKHCSNSFNIIFLNDKTINEWLPELNEKKIDLSRLKIAQRVDYYRILLLYKYGGLYMDIDILVMKDPIEIINKLNDEIDFVGFGCTGNVCKYGYGKPSNWLLASKPNTILMKNVLESCENKINLINKKELNNKDINYFDLGKFIIWEELEKLNKSGYKYFHYPNSIDGTRDVNGHWVTMGRLFSSKEIDYEDERNLMLVVLYNSDLDDFDKSFRTKTKEELLNYNINFVKYYKRSITKYY
jgi:hypothetical protein